MAKNRQKSVNIMKKVDFTYNNFPKTDISLRKCTKKKIAFGEKKVHKIFRACGAIPFPPRGVL